jgi:hypothetical protein
MPNDSATIPQSVFEKAAYGIALIVLFCGCRLPLSVRTVGSVDWIFAFLFLAAHFETKASRAAA